MAMEENGDNNDNGSPSSPQDCVDSSKTTEGTAAETEVDQLPPSCDGTEKSRSGEKGTRWSIDNNWGLSLEELFDMAVIFLKDKDGKAFHPTYEEKLRLVALQKQSCQGPYEPDAHPEVGFFDVLGNDRRKEWASLGKMTKTDAMTQFIQLLHACCPLFSPYITSHKIEQEQQEKKRREEEQRQQLEREEMARREQEEARRRAEEEERRQQEEEKMRKEEEQRLQMEQQKQQIMAALNAQTSGQFQQYATQQYPDDPEQQRALIQQLQEQHYQQYIQQAYQLHLVSQQQQPTVETQESPECSLQLPNNTETAEPPDAEHADADANSSTNTPPQDQAPPQDQTDTLTPPAGGILAPSMWTRPQIKDFKQKMHDDPDSMITVGRGEVVTVRVPTNEDGNYMFWEFATDHYDIGFGLSFEWTDSPVTSNSAGATPADEEDAGKGEDAEEMEENGTQGPPVEEVVPVYRRDSHEEVYAGSHQYPGQGTYLLKFDNSYSLWRTKTVYYRVYYTK